MKTGLSNLMSAYEILRNQKLSTIDRKQRNIFKYPCDK